MPRTTQTSLATFADSIWFNAQVHTMNVLAPKAQALAVRARRLMAVGSDAEVLALRGPDTVCIDAQGRFVMPGLIDTHVHPLGGGLRELFEVYVGFTPSLEQLLEAVGKRCAETAETKWITGGPWRLTQFDEVFARGESPRELLDRAAPNHPVALRDMSFHMVWLNSKAMQLCGLDEKTPDPHNGRIGRHPQTGVLDGILYEHASDCVGPFAHPTAAQWKQAVQYVRTMFHSVGVTGFKDAGSTEAELTAYAEADRADELNLHAAVHISKIPLQGGPTASVAQISEWCDKYKSRHVHTRFVKLMLDGVALSRTAAFFEPYLPACANCAEGVEGAQPQPAHNPDAALLVNPEQLKADLIEYDRLGFVVKMHATGDRAARLGLDAIQAARQANGPHGPRHEIAHSSFVHDLDKPRFKELNAVAEISPRLWFPNPVTPMQIAVLGKARVNRCHQIRQLLDSGADLTYGSDWPAAAADCNPWIGLAGMVTRRHPFGLFEGAIGEDQAVPLERALPLFTTNAARSMGLGAVTGSLEVGKSADFIVLEADIFTLSPRELASVKPLHTVFEGVTVFSRADGTSNSDKRP